MVVAEKLAFDGETLQRGQLIFEERTDSAFHEAKRNGQIVAVDPFGDLNIQLSVSRKEV